MDTQYVSIPMSTIVPWDGKNKNGEDAATGIYLIYIIEPFGRRTAKIALIR